LLDSLLQESKTKMLELSSVPAASSSSPPTYEEATDPSFAQKMLAKTPWPGFHPSKLPRQMSRQLSRNRPGGEDGDTNQGQLLDGSPTEDDSCCDNVVAALFMCFLCITFIFFVFIPVAMISLGAYYYPGECGERSPYPLWLIVGGSSICCIFLFAIILMVTETKNLGLYCIFGLLLVFPLIWYVMGCWWLWGSFTHPRGKREPEDYSLTYGDWWPWLEFLETDCAYTYWVTFGLVVTPLGLIAIGLGCVILGGIIICFSTNIDDDE